LEEAVAAGRFREDLYYRVRVVEIDLPPLRERGPDEIERLARHFAAMYAQRYERPAPRIDADALRTIRAHTWPGNVRELEHWIESAIALAPEGRITSAHLPSRRREVTGGAAPASSSAPFSSGPGSTGLFASAPQPVGSHAASAGAQVRDPLLDTMKSAPDHAAAAAPASQAQDGLGQVTLPLGLSLDEAAKRYVEATLVACDGNKTEAARRLEVGRNTIARALHKKSPAER
jgi:Nif-specific regulatory protein